MKHRTSEHLYEYWNEVRGPHLAPRRFDIEPGRIASALPETFILERTDEGGYGFRLAGTRICEHLGSELRGTDFLDGWREDDRATLSRGLASAAEQGGVLWIEMSAVAEAPGRSADFEILILPLIHKGAIPDRFLGCWCALSPPSWLSMEKLDRRLLHRMELIWPDGRPHAVVERFDNQSPFLPHIRYGRLVRSDRRQFRVYDGGLSKADPDRERG